VMEAQGKHIEAVVASGNAEIKARFEELIKVRREIAKLQTSRRADASFEDLRNILAASEKQKEALEAILSAMSRGFSVEKKSGRADTANIARILPDNSTYLDFARIAFFDFQKKTWNDPRYLVFILKPGAKSSLALIDLGPSETIDLRIHAYMKTMSSARTGYVPNKRILDKESGDLYRLLLQPIEPYLSSGQHLYISPDGNLNLIPFEVLMNAQGSHVIDNHQISYISAGRDIVRLEDREEPHKRGMALILSDPDYDFGLSEAQRKESGSSKTAGAASSPKPFELAYFSRLPDTKDEANTIRQILSERMHIGVNSYQNDKAVEAVLHAAESPIIMHLATHGYFIGKEEFQSKPNAPESSQMLFKDYPMLRSGIALAGINLSLKEGKDEGIMSAEKVMGLKLIGTDLVVLSACETGVGDVQSGEGVFGLKRAFILSGAKAVILSLWSVPSRETMDLMTRFYSLMADGKSKAKALMQAKLELKAKKPNPFYWGAFVLVGNPD
jgi:CHAT domain-containing protein